MEEKNESIFISDFDDVKPVERRWAILPLWIRIFTWGFLIAGALMPFIILLRIFRVQVIMSLYGLETTNVFSTTGLILASLFMLKGIAAYGLWAEKNWAILIAQIDALLGIIICIAYIFIRQDTPNGFTVIFRLDLILLVVYIVKLYRIKHRWEESGK
ncbi:hypothetical protein SAMN05518672_103467 [Chitinophaga sp. CF118]|uniref:hypothetical protein n=1 Tax=Chitinophaga sp. CF118 TaxID=1884367 RepID=UPI0008E4723D|nr:hypothetical protein [Chitinophaga sp. CF118]SFD84242.1 hypothetical protein SAMN05518672_103467 [Chitinophaga sp. CF118]